VAANPEGESSIAKVKVEKASTVEPKTEKARMVEPDTLSVATKIQEIPPTISIPNESLKKDSVFSITVVKGTHIVQTGETLYSIARQNSVGVMDLVNWNGLNLQEGIKPGQVLNLFDNQYVTPNTEPTEIIHEVGLNDTLYSVARKYGVTIKEMMEWNEKKDFNVSVGEKLRIIRK
jgi:membrane-bound lytic murein transglycosylase D